LAPNAIKKLQTVYESILKEKQQADINAQRKIQKYIDEVVEKAKANQKRQEPTSSPLPNEPVPQSEQSQTSDEKKG
jgi:hypothetical protein